MSKNGAIVGALLFALLLPACGDRAGGAGQMESQALPGQMVPTYAARTLEGDSVSFADHRGEVLLVNVWATWCPPCRKEIPELDKLHQEFRDQGFRVIGISTDAEGANALVKEFLDDYDVGYDIWRDPGDQASSAFALRGLPTSFLVDREGEVVWRHVGPLTADDPALREVITTTL